MARSEGFEPPTPRFEVGKYPVKPKQTGISRVCIKLATDNMKPALYEDIRAMETWSKDGKRVVELGYFDKKDSKRYMPRICVVGDGRVQIVSMFENSIWRQ